MDEMIEWYLHRFVHSVFCRRAFIEDIPLNDGWMVAAADNHRCQLGHECRPVASGVDCLWHVLPDEDP